jgi:nucleotide-binding universal stress UspA family protein
MFKHILLAYNGSESARHAAKYAEQLACKFKCQIDVVYAFGPIQHGMDDSLRQAHIQEEINAGDALIGNLLATFECAGIITCGHVLEGLPADVILAQAHDDSNDLIVIGSQGLRQPEGYLLGSVSDRVVHDADCPVLVVK